MTHAETFSNSSPYHPAAGTCWQRLITLPRVRERIPLDRTTIWKMVRDDKFPKPVDLGIRRLAWRESDINAWIAGR